MFFVTLLLSQVRGWLRRQRGAATLRALLYFDEISAFARHTLKTRRPKFLCWHWSSRRARWVWA